MENDRRTLRVGLLLNDLSLQRWQADCLGHLLAVPGVELVVRVMKAPVAVPKPAWHTRLLRYPWKIALYLHYRRRHFHPAAMERVQPDPAIIGIPELFCATERRGHAEYFSEQDLEKVRQFRPDVLLRFGFNILRGGLLDLPTYGVWSFHHGDEQRYRGGPVGFWELANDEPMIGAILQRLTDKLDAGIVLKKGWFRTVPVSLERTVDQVLGHAAVWPAQVMRAILDGEVPPNGSATTSAPILKYPGNATLIRSLLHMWRKRWALRSDHGRSREEWNIGVLYQPVKNLLDEVHNLNVRWLPAPAPGSSRSQPFGILDEQDQLILLYRKQDHRTGPSGIHRLRPKRDNTLKRSRNVLSSRSDLAYPFIIRSGERTYVVPDGGPEGRVDLYQSDDLLGTLDHVTTLLDVPLVAPTLVKHDGLWWLFGTLPPLSDTELFLYHSEMLEGPYTPHPMNPVKVDVRSARPAGTFFMHEGVLYRPAQDNSGAPGGRIALNRVVRLDTRGFREEVVKFIGPFPGTAWNKGTGTLAAVGNVTLVDGMRVVQAAKGKVRKHGHRS